MKLEHNDGVVLKRDVQATIIPHGQEMPLPAGTLVRVVQNLGGSHTIDVNGNWFMVHEEDMDALGATPDPKHTAYIENDLPIKEKVWAALRQCYDPEIPVNIVDLGLIYHVDTFQQDKNHHASITMTLTSPGCGMGPVMMMCAKKKIFAIPGIEHVDLDLVFDPPWDRSMMSDEAKLTLGVI